MTTTNHIHKITNKLRSKYHLCCNYYNYFCLTAVLPPEPVQPNTTQVHHPPVPRENLFMVALWNRADHYIFALWLLLSFFYSSTNVSRRTLDICHTFTHGVALVRISDAGLKPAACGSLKTQDAKKSPKIAIWAPSHNFVGLYLRN